MPEAFDVAIVGLGPAGASLANLLGQAGLSVAVFEREAAIYPLPRVIHFDGEVMRIFHGMGLTSEIEAATRPGFKNMHFVNAQNQVLLVRGGSTAVGPHGCANNHYFHQPQLEAVLREGLARFPRVSVLLRHEVFAIAEDTEGALLSVENMSNGSLGKFRAQYVIGCDGARSLVRRLMGSSMEDLGLHQPLAGIRRHSQALSRPARPHRAALRPSAPDDLLQRDRPAAPLGDHVDAGRRCAGHRATGEWMENARTHRSRRPMRNVSVRWSTPFIR